MNQSLESLPGFSDKSKARKNQPRLEKTDGLVEGRKHGNRFKNLLGSKFNRLTPVRLIGRNGSGMEWLCLCDCGNHSVVKAGNLLNGHIKSCGCLKIEAASKLNFTHGFSHSNTQEYRIWMQMRSRCNNPKNKAFRIYGGRGIKVCESWKSFVQFFKDMGKRTHPKHQIDRINTNGNYEPNNCRLATVIQQQNNRRNNRMLSAFGKSQTLAMWGREFKINPQVISNRLIAGWAINRAISKPTGRSISA